ncbi:ribosome small subunit-dependent GTPase A [Paenibacillus sambharensis]|uniref:Small ribosomal subunit biogenesis GTPase RsgA n=1 Tax=Paenibacillus sambharensis TaxID=1803190 RepID=A0A2W1LFN9_9BACL|nr:ribosome small subunit-dependent GTPase A [Paenibacillus sambharensis]PZD93254.1 ribosome small subunit-dependent GTPase A [Paenibacillus sambharensis]
MSSSPNSSLTGTIVKALSGYYYVVPDGQRDVEDSMIQCRARGVFKKKGLNPLVGDRVVYVMTDNGEGTVSELLPRQSELIRPPVANVELAVLVFALTEPSLNLQLLDKFLAHIEHAGIEAVLCLSKRDLADNSDTKEAKEALEAMEAVQRIYPPIGYDILVTSSRSGDGTEALRERMRGRVAVFCGQSGVGKSSLLNALVPGLELETNAISAKLGRGKHTTRHVELIRVEENTFIADTPGFSQLDFQELGIEELGSCFREFRELSSDCKFRGCTHVHEPECAVREALEAGRVAASRYDNYLQFLAELKEKKRRY